MFLVHYHEKCRDEYNIFKDKKEALVFFRKELEGVKSYLHIEHYETIYYNNYDEEKTEAEILEFSYQELIKSELCQTVYLEYEEYIGLYDLTKGNAHRH